MGGIYFFCYSTHSLYSFAACNLFFFGCDGPAIFKKKKSSTLSLSPPPSPPTRSTGPSLRCDSAAFKPAGFFFICSRLTVRYNGSCQTCETRLAYLIVKYMKMTRLEMLAAARSNRPRAMRLNSASYTCANKGAFD